MASTHYQDLVAKEEERKMSITEPVGGNSEEVGVFPLDIHNAKLLDLVAPHNWTNPTPDSDLVYDVVAIGAGAGGLVSSKQTARRGGKSALIEKHMAGGDCLNVGCVPSKALLRCARALREAKEGKQFGLVNVGENVAVDFGQVMERMRRLRTRIAPADSYAGAQRVGVDVYQGHARFTGPNTLEVAGTTIRFRNAVVATGGRAYVPPIPGLEGTPFLTNANLYNLTTLPPRMVVLGGGPIGSEMAQAFATFGSQVTIISRGFLSKEDKDARQVVMEALQADGVQFSLQSKVTKVEHVDGVFRIHVANINEEGDVRVIEAEQVLVATGRAPNVEGLGLEKAGVKYTVRRGVEINDFMQTSNPNIYAVGDVCHPYQFTHMSGQMAIMVVDNILFGEQRKVSEFVVPWVTYTEPEVAHVGKYAHEVEGGVDTYTASLEHNDRAILEGCDNGFFRVHCKKGTDEIVGGTIVAANAGEMIPQFTLCVQFGIPMSHDGLGQVIHAYPTVASGAGSCMWGYKVKYWKTLKDGKVIGGDPNTTAVAPDSTAGAATTETKNTAANESTNEATEEETATAPATSTTPATTTTAATPPSKDSGKAANSEASSSSSGPSFLAGVAVGIAATATAAMFLFKMARK